MFYTRTEAYCISWGNYVKQILTPYTTVEMKTFHILQYSICAIVLYTEAATIQYELYLDNSCSTFAPLFLVTNFCITSDLKRIFLRMCFPPPPFTTLGTRPI